MRRRETTESRYRRLKARYVETPPKSIRSGVLDCFFFNGLTDAQTAEILQTPKEAVLAEVEQLINTPQARLSYAC